MDLDPFALIVLLNLNRFLLQAIQLFQLADPLLESFLFAVVEDAGDDSFADVVELEQEDDHHDKHDQVEQSELQDDEEAVSDEDQEDKGTEVQEDSLD